MTIDQNDESPGFVSARRALLRGRISLLLVIGGIVLLALIYPFPVDGRLWSQIFDLAHAPVFFLLLIAIAGFVDPTSIGLSPTLGRLWTIRTGETMLIAGGCFLFGCVGEFLQGFAGRSPSALDLIANGTGVMSGVLWLRSQQKSGRRRIAYAVVAFCLLASATVRPVLGIRDAIQQQAEFPLLASFERLNDLGAWHGRRASILRSSAWASDGQYSLQIELSPGKFTGANLIWPVRNWSGYDHLCCDIYNPATIPISVTVKIFDVPHTLAGYEPTDRFETTIEIPPSTVHPLSIDLANVAAAPETRSMDMRQITAVELFAADLPAPRTIHLDNMRLLGKSDLDSSE